MQYLIDQWIFNERHRLILADRLFNGTTYERLAEKYGLSTQQVKTIVYKAMDRRYKTYNQSKKQGEKSPCFFALIYL